MAKPLNFGQLWASFWKWTSARPVGTFLFRGQADSSPIIPKIGRSEYNYDPSREEQLFKAFKRAAHPFISGNALSEWELLALAQHHGAPTRLVDWSTSPLVAAWFAVTSFPVATDAKIFALDVSRKDIQSIDVQTSKGSAGGMFAEPLAIKNGVYLIETPSVTARITTQRGLFTVHGVPTAPLAIPKTNCFTVPAAMRTDFQGQLLDVGIDASHIFPDIDGLCRTLDWRLRSGKGFSAFT